MSGTINGINQITVTLPLTWTNLSAALQTYLQEVGSADFTNILQIITNNAEMRIYRELDFISTRAINNYTTFTAGQRHVSLSNMWPIKLFGDTTLTPWPVIITGVNAYLNFPYWVTDDYGNLVTDDNGNPISTGIIPYRQRFTPVSLDFIDGCWPDASVMSQPGNPFAYYTVLNDDTLIVCPTPDQSYPLEVIGNWRPSPMSSTNQSTWLATNLPDLFFAACMIEAVAYQRDFSAQGDNPQAASAWEAHYQMLKQGAMIEEHKKKHGGQMPVPPPMPPAGAPRR